MGGYLAEIPEPHVRYFPGPEPRRVKVFPAQVFRHFHTSIQEADNPIWHAQEELWVMAWDDDAGRGRHFFEILDSPLEVTRWVVNVVENNFSGPDYFITDYMNYLSGDESDLPDYIVAARAAARRAARREGD